MDRFILLFMIAIIAGIIVFLVILGMGIFITFWYPLPLFCLWLVSNIVTLSSKSLRCRSLWIVWLKDKRDKLCNKHYWPYWPSKEIKKLRRSYLLLIMHIISCVVRWTSALQNSKAFFECKPKNRGEVPAWVIEVYVFLWLIYIVLLGIFVSIKSEWFSHPFVSGALLAILIYRAIHIVHGNLYYGLLRSMYTGLHRVHNPSRNLALLIVSYAELCLLCAIAYLRLGDQFTPPLTNFWDAFYLSAVTITTLGYGDIRPDCSSVRVLMGLEALSGLALLALAITRFLTEVPHPKVGSNDAVK